MVNKNYLNYRGVYEFYILNVNSMTTTCVALKHLEVQSTVQSLTSTGILV